MRQPALRRHPWIATFFALVATGFMSGEAAAQTTLVSDDFEAYTAGEELNGNGGWRSSKGSGQENGVTVIEGASTSGGGANARIVRYHDDSGTDPNPDMRYSFPAQSDHAVESSFLLRLNKLDGKVGMHNIVLRGAGGAAARLRFGPDGLILLGSRDEAGNARKQGHTIIARVVEGDWYRVTLTADPTTQTAWASAANLDRTDAAQRGESPPLPFFSKVSSLSRWAVERASMTPVDISIDDVQVRVMGDTDLAAPVDASIFNMPGKPRISHPDRTRMTEGRIDGEEAVLVEQGSVGWQINGLQGHHFFEFWFTPVNWNAVLGDEVVIGAFKIADEEFVLYKPAERSELRLMRQGEVLQVYPTYAWDHRDWMEAGGGAGVRGLIRKSSPWHHVHVAVSGGRVSLTVDGFPARRVQTGDVSGTLTQVELHGAPGTAFAAVNVETGTPLEPDELRDRYITLFLNEPSIMRNMLTVPYLSSPPSIDGEFSKDEWAGAARIIGFSKVDDGAALVEEVIGYIGYDAQRLYLAVFTPTKEQVAAPHRGERDMPLWDEESVAISLSPPFVSGEDPRRVIQLIGNPHGSQTDLTELPTRDMNWNGDWDWKASTDRDGWYAEFGAHFGGLGLPEPNAHDMWGFNLVNPQAKATWSHVDTGVNLGNLRFQREAPVIRPDALIIGKETAGTSFEIVGGKATGTVTVGIQLFGEGDRLPRKTVQKDVPLSPGEMQRTELEIDLEGADTGRIALFVREGHTYLYYHSVKYPAVEGR